MTASCANHQPTIASCLLKARAIHKKAHSKNKTKKENFLKEKNSRKKKKKKKKEKKKDH